MMFKRLKIKGFTLIELMIVLAICGIVASMIIPKFMEMNSKIQNKTHIEIEQLDDNRNNNEYESKNIYK